MIRRNIWNWPYKNPRLGIYEPNTIKALLIGRERAAVNP